MTLDELEIRCYSGHTYAERPKSFRWQGIAYEVAEIEKTWQEPGKRCFQVSAGDNKLFNLCYNETRQQWSLTAITGS